MLVLGLDTSGRMGGAALAGPQGVLAEYVLNVQATHAERLMPAVARLLEDALPQGRPDGVAVVMGPGSFTGLRIGVAAAKVLAYAWRVPVMGVSSLEALAWQAGAYPGLICPMLDARWGHVYSAAYRGRPGPVPAPPEPVLEPAHRPLDAFLRAAEELAGQLPPLLLGDGLNAYEATVRGLLDDRWVGPPAGGELLRSGSVATLGRRLLLAGQGQDPFQLTPLYLRPSEAEARARRAAAPAPSSG